MIEMISKKTTAWKKSRKFGDVKGGRRRPKLADNIFSRFHSLQASDAWETLPICIKDNPSRDFYFSVSAREIVAKLATLPDDDWRGITHLWLRKVKTSDYQNGDTVHAMFICGGGVNLIVLNAFPTDLKMLFGAQKPQAKHLQFYAPWCRDLRFDNKRQQWFLQWQFAAVKEYFLDGLLMHEIGHFVDSKYKRFYSSATVKKRENFADMYARVAYLDGTKQLD